MEKSEQEFKKESKIYLLISNTMTYQEVDLNLKYKRKKKLFDSEYKSKKIASIYLD